MGTIYEHRSGPRRFARRRRTGGQRCFVASEAFDRTPARRGESFPGPSRPETRPVEVDASYGENNVIIYRILDEDTKDLIQQIPPEQLLEIARSVREMLQARAIGTSLDVRS